MGSNIKRVGGGGGGGGGEVICKGLASYLGKEEIVSVTSCQSNQTWLGASVMGFSVMGCLVVQV